MHIETATLISWAKSVCGSIMCGAITSGIGAAIGAMVGAVRHEYIGEYAIIGLMCGGIVYGLSATGCIVGNLGYITIT